MNAIGMEKKKPYRMPNKGTIMTSQSQNIDDEQRKRRKEKNPNIQKNGYVDGELAY